MIDMTTEFGTRVARRLEHEPVIWLTTMRADNTPQPSPVWFLWDGATFLIYSQPDTPKVRNIAAQPHVSLNFDSDGKGGDIVVFTGQARIDDGPPANEVAAYVNKYAAAITGIGMTPESFAQTYSVALRVVPMGVRGH